MKYFTLDDADVKNVLNENVWGSFGIKVKKEEPKTEEKKEELKESKQEETPVEEEVITEEEVEVEEHTCPLCESHLENPVSKEALREFTETILEAIDSINEMVSNDDDEAIEVEDEEDVEEEVEEEGK